MKLKLDDLKKCHAVIDRVAANPGLVSSQYVKLHQEAGRLTFSLTGILWAESSMKSDPNGGKWTFHADRLPLAAFLNAVSGETMEFGVTKDKVLVARSGGHRLDLPDQAQPISGYESWKPTKLIELDPRHMAALGMMAECCPKGIGMEHVEAVNLISGWGSVATDTLVIAALLEDPKQDLMLPPDFCAALGGMEGVTKIAVEKSGVGVALPGGWIYQPLAAHTMNYPVDMVKGVIAGAMKAKPTAVCPAESLNNALTSAATFMQVVGSAKVAIANGKAVMTVEVGGGKYERAFVMKGDLAVQDITWPVSKLARWVAYVAGLEPGALVAYAKMKDASVLRTTAAKQRHVLVFADS